jgi:hypothetical protein
VKPSVQTPVPPKRIKKKNQESVSNRLFAQPLTLNDLEWIPPFFFSFFKTSIIIMRKILKIFNDTSRKLLVFSGLFYRSIMIRFIHLR